MIKNDKLRDKFSFKMIKVRPKWKREQGNDMAEDRHYLNCAYFLPISQIRGSHATLIEEFGKILETEYALIRTWKLAKLCCIEFNRYASRTN